MRAEEILDEIRMLPQELRMNDQVGDNELMIGPQVTFIEENAAAPIVDEPRGPWFGRPGGVKLSLDEKRQLIGDS